MNNPCTHCGNPRWQPDYMGLRKCLKCGAVYEPDEWVHDNGRSVDGKRVIEAVARHCNPDLGMDDQTVVGHFGDDGFYLEEGGELSFNWDIIKWRYRK